MSKSHEPAPRAPDDAALAWELAAAARSYLGRVDADRIHVAIGLGETFTAIDALITAIALDRIPLTDDLITTVYSWLDCYAGQDAEPRLRLLVADVNTSSAQPLPALHESSEPRQRTPG
jgi:hypothetical protein